MEGSDDEKLGYDGTGWMCRGLVGVHYACVESIFFQAEDGIRDRLVTGVQTCALPISNFIHTQS